MMIFLLALQIAARTGVPGQIDRVCQGEYCESLSVSSGNVRFIKSVPSRTIVLGKLASSARKVVPPTEAPLRDIPFERGRVVASVFLQHSGDDQGLFGIRTRILTKNGKLDATFDMFGLLLQADLGSYFGGQDQILTITSEEEHAYNVQTEVWLLPANGVSRRLLSFPGIVDQFQPPSGTPPGILVSRETYDGEHAETKGRVKEFWAWDPREKRLIEPKRN